MILQQLSGRRKRRHRTIFTDEQLAILESNFSANAYPDIALRVRFDDIERIWFAQILGEVGNSMRFKGGTRRSLVQKQVNKIVEKNPTSNF